ncbi:DUF2098 domain-containing protein [Methanobacterium congolense]|uniref:DUF2098 domain-containing protein n=1 Tax=Methanobacterium congolense TaxID=118062 RepID=A0A1D3L1C5_9EURY|nr:DUF2098 family protein [Methanobacterium congolense]SCG85299.1 putative protein [Methanobacterium congolense]
MEVKDALGKTISKGFYVRYSGTGSAGTVIDLKSDESGNWAKVDATELWYQGQYLEIIDKVKYENLNHGKTSEPEETQTDREMTNKKLEKAKKIKLDDVDMSSELCDGGG